MSNDLDMMNHVRPYKYVRTHFENFQSARIAYLRSTGIRAKMSEGERYIGHPNVPRFGHRESGESN